MPMLLDGASGVVGRGLDFGASLHSVGDAVCAVERRRFPVGVRPTRQLLQPEATGAAMEVTK